MRPKGDPAADAAARAAILAADPEAVITGFDAIDRALRGVLARDLVLVGGVALLLVAIGMRLVLRSARHALVALATLACEMGVVGLAMRVLSVRWHVYDALVLPGALRGDDRRVDVPAPRGARALDGRERCARRGRSSRPPR